MSLLGIDVGTTGCKAAAFALDGRCIASAYREVPTESPRPGWAQLDAARVFALVKESIAEVAAAASDDPVTAMSVSSMGEAATPVTLDRQILGPSILMSDARGGQYVDRLAESIGPEAFYAINPNILAATYTMPKLCWLRDNQPDLYRRADRFLLWADLIVFLLGGRDVTCHSLANRTLLFDLGRQDWSDRLIELGGLDREKLADCAAAGTVAGSVPDALAAELGLPKGVALVVGGHDQCCNALGAGAIAAGSAVCGIGTYECIAPVYERVPDARAMLANGFNVEHHVLAGRFVSFLYNQGGSLVRWFRDTFAAADRRLAGQGADIYDALSAEMPDGPTSLLTLPHFETTGPPRFAADSAGVILGLRTATTRGEILKSIMESVTFYLAENVEALGRMGIGLTELIATGGGAKSDAWLQIKADIFGLPLIRPRITEASTLGAAMLAGLATSIFATPAEAVDRFVARRRTFEPDPARHAAYQHRLAEYRKLYPALRELLRSSVHGLRR
jgi:xylulokinase